MNNSTVVASSQSSTSNLVWNVIASLIASALIVAGTWLVDKQMPEVMALQYKFTEQRAGKLASWHLQLFNQTDVAFDVKVLPNQSKLIRADFSDQTKDGSGWSGKLIRGQNVEMLFVIEEPSQRLSSALVQEMISATYDDRNKFTGVMEARPGEVTDVGMISLYRGFLIIFWFLLPLSVAGILLLLWRFLRSRFKKN